jgi:hypothetical protein
MTRGELISELSAIAARLMDLKAAAKPYRTRDHDDADDYVWSAASRLRVARVLLERSASPGAGGADEGSTT